jgi:hypothetical protein
MAISNFLFFRKTKVRNHNPTNKKIGLTGFHSDNDNDKFLQEHKCLFCACNLNKRNPYKLVWYLSIWPCPWKRQKTPFLQSNTKSYLFHFNLQPIIVLFSQEHIFSLKQKLATKNEIMRDITYFWTESRYNSASNVSWSCQPDCVYMTIVHSQLAMLPSRGTRAVTSWSR